MQLCHAPPPPLAALARPPDPTRGDAMPCRAAWPSLWSSRSVAFRPVQAALPVDGKCKSNGAGAQDTVCLAEASRQLFSASAQKDKVLHIYPGLCAHALRAASLRPSVPAGPALRCTAQHRTVQHSAIASPGLWCAAVWRRGPSAAFCPYAGWAGLVGSTDPCLRYHELLHELPSDRERVRHLRVAC